MRILVTGAGGFIGHNLVKRLKKDGHTVVGADWKDPEFEPSPADAFCKVDLRSLPDVAALFKEHGRFDEVYSLAANMGGMGFIETHRALIMRDSALISIHVLDCARRFKAGRLFYSSSACAYNTALQDRLDAPALREEMAFPAMPEAGYGWEKLFTELLCRYFREDYGLITRMARYHNVYGPYGTWRGGREKAPAAICRKVVLAPEGGEIEVWGDGQQQRSFTFIDDCVEGTIRVLRGDHPDTLNVGSDEMVAVADVVRLAMSFEKKDLRLRFVKGPLGVRGRNSDNTRIKQALGWAPSTRLAEGLRKTYDWIKEEVLRAKARGEDLAAASVIPHEAEREIVA